MIVEDQEPMRAALREFLESAYPDANILEAANGACALELCRSHRPRLVLVDVGLPDASGFDLIARFRALAPGCAVIVVSQHSVRAYAEHAHAAGAFAYVNKDEIYHTLLQAVAGALERTPGSGPK